MSRNFYFQQPQNQCECGHLNNYEHSGKQLQIRGFNFVLTERMQNLIMCVIQMQTKSRWN